MEVAILNPLIYDGNRQYKYYASLFLKIFILKFAKFIYNQYSMKIKSSKILVKEALEQIKTITPSEALKKTENGDCNLIDIRDVRELQKEGKIDNSHHIPRGMLEFWLDPESAYFKDGKLDIKKPMVLFCAGGLRSALATKALVDMGFKNVANANGGFDALKNAGLKIVKKEKK